MVQLDARPFNLQEVPPEPAANSKTTTNVVAQNAIVRIRFPPLRERVVNFSSVLSWNVLVI